MLSDFLKKNITSQAEYIQTNGYGYGQVEPNHLSAQRTSQVYAQLPADPEIDVLEQGQFVKYDYAKGLVNFTGEGEWMLVFNEIKLYRDYQQDCEFAMVKDNYQARVYSPFGSTKERRQSRYYNGVDSEGNTSITYVKPTYTLTSDSSDLKNTGKTYYTRTGESEAEYVYTAVDHESISDESASTYYEMTNPGVSVTYDDVTAAPDFYEPHYNEDPFAFDGGYTEQMMPAGTTMVPRVFKTNVGDIFTTNTIGETSVVVGDFLSPREDDGILSKSGDMSKMKWQVVKVYTMPDGQPGVKVMRVA